MKIQLNLKTEHSIFGSNKCYGITQDPITKDFIIIMDNYLLDNLIDRLLYRSGNNVVDDFIINNNIKGDIMEFVPYDQFKDIEFIFKVKACKATWIDGNIQSWNKKVIDFKRNGPMQVVLKRLNDSENITSKELNEVHTVHINLIIIYLNIIKNKY